MTNIQDDQSNINNTVGDSTINDYQVTPTENQTPKSAPTKADVEELLGQLEALNKEIAAKTVVDQTQTEDKKEETAKLEAPLAQPAIEASDEPQLADTTKQDEKQQSDLDLDKFIDDLEAKIAQKNEVTNQEDDNNRDPMVKPTPTPTITPNSNPIDLNEEKEVETKNENNRVVEENFNQSRPSLDLSEVAEQSSTPLTLNNGQLEEAAPKMNDSSPSSTPEVADAAVQTSGEDLESQNLFTMLALEDLSDEEKEAFLKDLEQLIWDNFVDVELPLLLNSEEKSQADQILADNNKTENERKEALLVYLEKFVPNLEEIMYKKALNLKREMFEERLKKLRASAAEENNLSLMADLDQIQELIEADRYKTAVNLLNKT
jgi:hypothetical protein